MNLTLTGWLPKAVKKILPTLVLRAYAGSDKESLGNSFSHVQFDAITGEGKGALYTTVGLFGKSDHITQWIGQDIPGDFATLSTGKRIQGRQWILGGKVVNYVHAATIAAQMEADIQAAKKLIEPCPLDDYEEEERKAIMAEQAIEEEKAERYFEAAKRQPPTEIPVAV